VTVRMRVKSVTDQPTIRGDEARAVRLGLDPVDQTGHAGSLELVLSPADARRFQVGDVFVVQLTEVKD